MNILIYTSMWQRYEITELFCRGINRFIKDAPSWVKPTVFAVVSEEKSAEICKKHGYHYVTTDNSPLGRKWNHGLDYCIKNYSWDYVLIMGDDDLISSETWKYYEPQIRARTDYFGFNQLYFHSLSEEKSINFVYESPDKLIGCGRFISRAAVMKAGYYSVIQFNSNFKHGHYTYALDEIISLPTYQADYLVSAKRATLIKPAFFNLWSDKQEKGLDNESEMRLLMNGYSPIAIPIPYSMMVDVKTERNINHFEKFVPLGSLVEVNEAFSFLSDSEKEQIEHIKKTLGVPA